MWLLLLALALAFAVAGFRGAFRVLGFLVGVVVFGAVGLSLLVLAA